MAIVTAAMFLTSLLAFTLEESNGILNRSGLYTAIFGAQAFAYFRNGDSLKSERIQFSIQIVAAGYFLSAISKLTQTGLGWINEAPFASIQMVKNYSYSYFDSGDPSQLNVGLKQAEFALKHTNVLKLLFAFSLLFEFFAWLALRSKRSAIIMGVLLTGMHIGIMYFMNILIAAIFYPMIIFFLNPMYAFFSLGFRPLLDRLKTGKGIYSKQ
jgi:hypothetical protein